MFCQLLVGEGTRTRSRSYRTSFGPRGCPIDQGCPRQQEIVLFGCCFSACELLISSSIYIVCGVFILLEISNHFTKAKSNPRSSNFIDLIHLAHQQPNRPLWCLWKITTIIRYTDVHEFSYFVGCYSNHREECQNIL